MKTILKLSFIISGLFFFLNGFAQNDEAVFKQVISKDSAAVNALALYPVNVRNTIFEACTHPEVLIRMDALQQETREQFKSLLSLHSKEEQQKIWDITRYPGLVNQLADEGKKTKAKLTKIMETFPSEIRETALEYGRSHHDVFVKINELNKSSDYAFEELIKTYPRNAQYAFRELVKYPELISILNSNMQMAVLVGDIYKRNPNLIKRKLDSLNTVLAEQNAKDLKDWQEGLEKNPKAKKEFEESAREYARSQGYHDDDLVVHDTKVVVEYVTYPYPYWYGYPWWWDYAYWYPYPYWYDWGFYYGPFGMVYIGFPSWYFMHWHFFYNPHHYYYPYFSDYCINHYYGHRSSFNDPNKCVSEWVKTNERNLPEHFLDNDSKRPERLKEFGKFEMDYSQHTAAYPGKNISRNDFLKENKSEYKNMSGVFNEEHRNIKQEYRDVKVEEPREIKKEQRDIDYDYWEMKQDRPKYDRYVEPDRRIQRDYPLWQQQKPTIRFPQQAPDFQQIPQQNRKSEIRPQTNPRIYKGPGGKKYSGTNPDFFEDFNRMNEAQKYHRNSWDKK
jgi:hypothetical protein